MAAIWAAALLSLLFVLGAKWLENGGTPVYYVVVSCTVIFLFFSYALPIALGLFAYGGPKWPTHGAVEHGAGRFFAVCGTVDRWRWSLIFVHRRAAAQPVGAERDDRFSGSHRAGLVRLRAAGVSRVRRWAPTIAQRQAQIAAAEAALLTKATL